MEHQVKNAWIAKHADHNCFIAQFVAKRTYQHVYNTATFT